MFKLACLFFCAVAVSLSGVVRAGEEDAEAFREAIKPFITECAKEHGISWEDIAKAKETHTVSSLKPCFVGCIFKKFEIINDKGEYDLEANLNKIKMFVKNEDLLTQLRDIMKKCVSVNDESVSDGNAGCERAMLLAKCFAELKSEILI
ncbi:hypothetical protein PYW07_012209 [Mythimna separata]|uniref:Uncharacterized protein n=1 Tax=Mythimna separata TaxID=271217 RepID=A0AAD8DTD1_MYTSE|nr:hypothetical protein PYW07_012209 [Mythimna separata]